MSNGTVYVIISRHVTFSQTIIAGLAFGAAHGSAPFNCVHRFCARAVPF